MAFTPGEEDYEFAIDNLNDLKFNQERFIKEVFDNKYILIVGNEVILNTKVEPTGDVYQYLLRHINRSLHAKYKNFSEVTQHYNEMIDPIRNLLMHEEFKRSMVVDDISEELQALLRTKLFKFIITTTFDSYMEILMRDIWGDRLRIVNIWDQSSLSSFYNRLGEYEDRAAYNEPTLIYAFGKCEEMEGRKYARDDFDYILTIEQWMSLDKRSDRMMKFIQSKRLLSLGCKFDDWYFRFFWFILKREREKQHEGEIAIAFDDQDRSDRNLQKYLFNTRIVTHGNARAFMREVTKAFTSSAPDNPYRDFVLQYRRRGVIFFSYCNEDKKIALEIYQKLRQIYPDLWFDQEKIIGGDDYDAEIRYGIEHAKVFIPLLSSHVMADLRNGRIDNYYNKEWMLAAKRNQELPIIPLAADGYQLRESYHQEFERIIGKSLTGIDLTEPDAFNYLKKAIDNYLGKEK